MYTEEFKGKYTRVLGEKRKLKNNQIIMQKQSDTVCEEFHRMSLTVFWTL